MELNAAWQIGLGILGVIGPGVGTILWFLFQSVRTDARSAKTASEALEKELATYKLYVAEHYVTQTSLAEKISSLQQSIERLIAAVDRNAKETRDTINQMYERLDKKADK